MKSWLENLKVYSFRHIYIEKEIINNSNTKNILKHFKNSNIIEIDHYKDIFCRGKQNFLLQKNCPNLILARKDGNLIYEGAKVCEDFGNDYFYYTSSIMNCFYNCEYCYLQGMYPSANIVIFVNIEDVFDEVKNILKSHPMYLCISYDTDLLAFENITGFVGKWIEFAKEHKNLKIEIRTKSANFNPIENLEPLNNVILAWTLSPKEIIENYEKGTPDLKARLKSIKNAMNKNWKVRLCFDPLLYVKQWHQYYYEFINEIFNYLDENKILDVSIGVFRVSKDYLKKMEKIRPRSKILAYPFEINEGVCTYSKCHSKELIEFVYKETSKHIDKDKIFI